MKIRLNHPTNTPSHWRNCRIVPDGRLFALRTFYVHGSIGPVALQALGFDKNVKTSGIPLKQALNFGEHLEDAFRKAVVNVARSKNADPRLPKMKAEMELAQSKRQ